MKKVVVLTGAGISAESGLQTFRDQGGLWEKYDPYRLASPEGWAEDPALVLEFYNVRRNKVREALPNPAHLALVKLEEKYEVIVITQNVDNLHEKAGSSIIVHLHGEIMKARSSVDERLVYDLGEKDIEIGDKCEKGSQLRPHVVWFGEMVPMIKEAAGIVASADIFMVVGTSLAVYPAANLINDVPPHAEIMIIDRQLPELGNSREIRKIEKPASVGVPEFVDELLLLNE